eukprot:4738218-Amphidinium_carterae.1
MVLSLATHGLQTSDAACDLQWYFLRAQWDGKQRKQAIAHLLIDQFKSANAAATSTEKHALLVG